VSDFSRKLELDIYIPSISIAFEYQGEVHYTNSNLLNSDQERIFEIDIEKKNACKNLGITLIEVPFWWDRQKETLAATIHQHRPDLIPDPGPYQPIPLKPLKPTPVLKKGNVEIHNLMLK
jgi:hypothetical protein